MKKHSPKRHPAETAFLSNPVASAQEATGCEQEAERDPFEEPTSPPVKGAAFPNDEK